MQTIIRLQTQMNITEKVLESGLIEIYQQYKEILYFENSEKILTTRATFQDQWIEDMALLGQTEASEIWGKIRI